MIKVNKTFKSNRSKFEAFVRGGVNTTLNEMGSVGVTNIKSVTPVQTGQLRGSNRYDVRGEFVLFSNNMDYAPYIEFGTRFHPANPFMRRGINNSMTMFSRIIVKDMGV